MDRIFYGLIFVLLSVQFNTVDLLPDWLGYLLMYPGLGQLASESRHFAALRPLCLVMNVYTLLLNCAGFSESSMVMLGMVSVAVKLYMLRRLVQGMEELQAGCTTANLEIDTLRSRWTLVVTAEAVVCAAVLLGMNGLITGLIGLASIIISVLFLMVFHRARLAYRAARL
ncbi:MAG: hypothetical protein IKB58_01580 [Oscillospiraceae bacterium]|nr:hypothetical protein [Oscillospiraceae bacterium]MBR6677840.1 hypothetical protein [Oscillospiraceae bacterium]